MSTNQLNKIFKDLDVEKLKTAMFEVVSSLIAGQEPIIVSVPIELKIPKPIFDMVKEICTKANFDHNKIFSKMASDGFKDGLETILKMAQSVEKEVAEETSEPSKNPDILEQLGEQLPQFKQMFESLKPLKEMASQLDTIKKDFQNAEGSISISTPKVEKDSK